MNEASYNAIARKWDEARQTLGSLERGYLEALLAGLPEAASVIDVGCGTGRPMAEFVLGRGHRITGVDQSAELLAIARARFPSATWIRAAIEAYPFEGEYDAAICWDSLFHIDRVHHERILTRLHRCLAPGGHIMLTVGGSEHPAFTDTMFGHEFFYDSHPPERAISIMERIGFGITTQEFINLPTGGRDKGRYAIVARKARPGAASSVPPAPQPS